MAYTGTQAQTGLGASLSIGSGAVLVGEIISLVQSGKMNKTDDATNLESTDEEFINTIPTPGKWDVTMNRVSSDPGQAAMLAAFNSGSLQPFVATLKKTPAQTTTGDKYSFNALVEEFNDVSDLSPTKKITTKASLKVSGPVTLTIGS